MKSSTPQDSMGVEVSQHLNFLIMVTNAVTSLSVRQVSAR